LKSSCKGVGWGMPRAARHGPHPYGAAVPSPARAGASAVLLPPLFGEASMRLEMDVGWTSAYATLSFLYLPGT